MRVSWWGEGYLSNWGCTWSGCYGTGMLDWITMSELVVGCYGNLEWLLWELGMVAMTMVICCYDNMSGLLWRCVTVAMGIDGGCYGNKVWLSLGTRAKIPTGYMVKKLRSRSTCDSNMPSNQMLSTFWMCPAIWLQCTQWANNWPHFQCLVKSNHNVPSG